VSFEELHGAFVLLSGRSRRKRSEVSPLAGVWVLLSRIETKPAVFELSDHATPVCQNASVQSGGPAKTAPNPSGRPIGSPFQSPDAFGKVAAVAEQSASSISDLRFHQTA
jgi:hypothetical protein